MESPGQVSGCAIEEATAQGRAWIQYEWMRPERPIQGARGWGVGAGRRLQRADTHVLGDARTLGIAILARFFACIVFPHVLAYYLSGRERSGTPSEGVETFTVQT